MNPLTMAPKQFAFIQAQAGQILSNPTWDLVLIFVLLAGAFFYGISFGRPRVVINILYTYAAYAITTALPLDSIISAVNIGKIFFAKSAVLFVVFILLALLLGGRRRRWSMASAPWWHTFILSILQVGLLMHFMLQFLPKTEIQKLAPITKQLFADPSLHLWWVLLPIGVLIFLRRIDRDEY